MEKQINHEILEQQLLEVLELIRKNKELDYKLEARGLNSPAGIKFSSAEQEK